MSAWIVPLLAIVLLAAVAAAVIRGWIPIVRRINRNPNAGPLEFTEWPPPKIEVLLKRGVEGGFWGADLWNRRIDVNLAEVGTGSADFAELARQIAAVPNASVSLSVTSATDRSSSSLAEFGGAISELALSGEMISDAGLGFLSALPDLEQLDLSDVPLTDAGMAALAGLSRLRWLDVSRTRISDAGLQPLVELSQLEGLAVYETQLTDAALPTLAKLPRLKCLEFTGSQITIEAFRRILPEVSLGP